VRAPSIVGRGAATGRGGDRSWPAPRGGSRARALRCGGRSSRCGDRSTGGGAAQRSALRTIALPGPRNGGWRPIIGTGTPRDGGRARRIRARSCTSAGRSPGTVRAGAGTVGLGAEPRISGRERSRARARAVRSDREEVVRLHEERGRAPGNGAGPGRGGRSPRGTGRVRGPRWAASSGNGAGAAGDGSRSPATVRLRRRTVRLATAMGSSGRATVSDRKDAERRLRERRRLVPGDGADFFRSCVGFFPGPARARQGCREARGTGRSRGGVGEDVAGFVRVLVPEVDVCPPMTGSRPPIMGSRHR
jgi:hypothetical protein